MTDRFVPNANVTLQLGNTPQMGALLFKLAEEAAAVARDSAPVGDPATDPHPGQFRDSIEGVLTTELGVQESRVQTTDPNGAHIEFGTSKTPPHATLRRAVEQLGLIVR